MKIHQTLVRDPRTHALANSGQARIIALADDRAVAELRAELETFVCDGQYGDAIERIFASYLKNLDRPKQDAAWVSGFFGSGKSHLLKMLGHLWVDTQFPDGASARSLVPNLPDNVIAHLRELDMQVTRSRRPAVAAPGTLPAGSAEFVKMTVLSVILEAQMLPQQYAQARFCFWLMEQGFYDRVRGAIETAGKEWLKELNNLYVSGVIAKAILDCDPNFAADEKEARQTLRAQFPNKTEDITTAEFLEMARKALEIDGELPLTILILDEVQQYIGNSTDRAVAITEITEAIYTHFDSKIMLVASGQSALSATPHLQKLKDRFRINAQLSDADVEAVIRKVLLQKNASSVGAIKSILDENSGEVDKHLDGTRISTRSEDAQTIVADYPLLPSRRRFWGECFRAVDAAGTQSQLRSQLRILHDSLMVISDHNVGAVIPADSLFDAISADLVQTGVLLSEIDLRIRELSNGTETGVLRKRVCGLVFLINKLPREGGTDVGVRATARAIADLMVDDITVDSGPFRKQVETELERLADDGTLMKVGEEYRLQTTEGAEWDRAYREKAGALRQRDADIAVKRDQLFGAAVQQAVGEVRLLHGECKEKRTLYLHTDPNEPSVGGEQLVAWLRDGWSIAQKEVEGDARRRGSDDHAIHIFLPRKSADDLTVRIVEGEAARQVIDLKGIPSTNEGREARESVQSRYSEALRLLDSLISDITYSAKVYQGGGTEVFGDSLAKKLDTAAKASLARLFPEFSDGDHKSWGVALRRARDGNDEPLRIVDWSKATEDHPVVKKVYTEVGTGAKGSDIRKTLQSSPYGWPRDAIDTGLIALHRQGAIRAEINGQPIAPGVLDQNKISTTNFSPEKVRLGATDKLTVRALFQQVGLSVKSGEEEQKAAEFLDALLRLAEKAGGDAPLPPLPSTSIIDDLAKLYGSEQLYGILKATDTIKASLIEWQTLSDRAAKRALAWQQLQQMTLHSASLSVHLELQREIDAIKLNRCLLESDDQINPLVTKVANALRAALTEQASAFHEAYQKGLETLEADTSWMQLDEANQKAILSQVGLASPIQPSVKTNDDLLRELNHFPVDARVSAVAAVSERVTRALEEAARRIKPGARRVILRAATLEDEAAVKAWIEEQKTKLMNAVVNGPVIVG
jgi:hypothetical protein